MDEDNRQPIGFCNYCKESIYDDDYVVIKDLDYDKYYHRDCYDLMSEEFNEEED